MFKGIMVAVLICGFGVGAAGANNNSQPLVWAETDVVAIVKQQNEIYQDAQAQRGRYRDMSPSDRERLLVVQRRVLAALEGRTKTTELAKGDQMSLFNDLEEISALVNKAEDERMICERTRPIGSNRPVNICKTVAERRLEREQALEGRRRDSRCLTDCGQSNKTEGW